MITINTKKVLVPTDFSKTSVMAIKHAAYITKISEGELTLLHVIKRNDLLYLIMPAANFKSSSEITDLIEAKLEKLAQTIRKKYGIAVNTVIAIGNPTGEIIKVANKNKVGLIIMGTQGKNSTNSFFLGSNSYKVLTKSEVPVMTIRSNVPKIGYANILLPIDSSDHSRQKVNSAIQLASNFGANVNVLGLWGKDEPTFEHKLKVILPQIKKMAEAKKLHCTCEIVSVENLAEKTLDYAEKINADMVIIMSDQSSGLSSLILGTYAHQLVNHSPIPVLTIPPEYHPETAEMGSIGGMW